MNRRTILTAALSAPAVALAGSLPVATAATPIMALFRRHRALRNPDAAAGLKPSPEVLEGLAKAAVADAASQIAATAANAAIADGKAGPAVEAIVSGAQAGQG